MVYSYRVPPRGPPIRTTTKDLFREVYIPPERDLRTISQSSARHRRGLHAITQRSTYYHTEVYMLSHRGLHTITQRSTCHHTEVYTPMKRGINDTTQRSTYHLFICTLGIYKPPQRSTPHYTEVYSPPHRGLHTTTKKSRKHHQRLI